MSGDRSWFERLVAQILALLETLGDLALQPQALRDVLADFGVPPSRDLAALTADLGAIAALRSQLQALGQGAEPSFAGILQLLQTTAQAFEAVRRLEQGDAHLPDGVGTQIVEALLAGLIESATPAARPAGVLLGLIEPAEEQVLPPPAVQGGELVRSTFALDRFHLDRLWALLQDPVVVLRAEYANPMLTAADAAALADKLLRRIANLLRSLGVSCRYGINPKDREILGDTAAIAAHSLLVYVDDPLSRDGIESGVVLSLSSAQQGDLGLVVSPFGALQTQAAAGPWILSLDVGGTIDALAWGRKGLTLPAASAGLTATVSAKLVASEQDPFVLGAADGTRLEITGAAFTLDTELSRTRTALGLSASVAKSALVIAAGDSDGFLASLLPAGGLRTEFALGLGWSSEKGVTLQGGAGLAADVAVGRSFAGVTLKTLHLALEGGADHVGAEISATLLAAIGPVTVLIDRVGIAAVTRFPPSGGNLGIADLSLGIKRPSGLGLSIDAAGVVTGSGVLSYDEAHATYFGGVALSIHDKLTVSAFGLVSTLLPDGSRGYSLVVFITAADFRPIPLGFGFTLDGIGGMVAVHRSFDQDALREGLRNDSLGALLFPRDPVANAPAIMAALAKGFPARQGSYLMGLLLRVGWGTPTLIQMDLGVIVQFGSQKRLLVLGRISAILPSKDNDLVRLILDALGVIDFDQGTASIDAVLVDSRLVHKFPLTGDMALRARWTSSPGFILSVGGVNPHFTAPASLPSLQRVTIALSSGDNPRLTCDAYFAITSNTVQFGARAQLYAAAAGFSLEGDVGFDVLIQIAPLHFLAEFQASIQLKRGSHNLFQVGVAGELEGPRPLRVAGKATFSIFWFDYSVRFDKTLVDGEAPPAPIAVNVLQNLRTALAAPESWSTQAQGTHGVALRKLAPGPGLVLDPLGLLKVEQQVVPINLSRDIERFGGAPVSGLKRFQLVPSVAGQAAQTAGTTQAAFAPSQFFDLSDDEKLAAPSFESMDAGVVFGSDDWSLDPAQRVAAPLQFEPIVIDTLPQPPAPGTPTGWILSIAALEAVIRPRVRRFDNDGAPPAIALRAPDWKILPLDDGPAPAIDQAPRTYAESRATLAALNRAGARWQLVPAHELTP